MRMMNEAIEGARDFQDFMKAVTKQHREAQACERRLRQMAAKREKDAKRAARKAAEVKVPA